MPLTRTTAVGLVGGGAMGAGIAQVALAAGHRVYLHDQRDAALQHAARAIRSGLEKWRDKGKLTAEEATAAENRLHLTSELAELAACGLVMEAIVEDLTQKQALLQALTPHLTDTCIVASNTSSLSIAALASACRHPERFLGIHFFNPAPLMPLVEVVPAVQTQPGLADEVRSLMQAWNKVPVLAKDTPGFIVNRVARPFYGEALRLLEEGIADVPTIDWAMTELGGFRMGPFALMDFIGHDVNYRVTASVFEAFFYDPRYKPSFTQKRLFEAGYWGRKAGRGFYDYATDATPPEPVRDQALGQQILGRIVAMLINEAADALFWQVATAEDLELAMTQGVHYPRGLLAWADAWGPAHVVATLDALYHHYHEDRYRASPLLRRMAQEHQHFLAHVAHA
ncbi:3-hydroxybutyryl-CoA dehydrogenase [Catalinimonas alkaloidigena]|uniref:3-hydroxybutyryl-CoA dehydrogenase n=1 Tax=Catalinimonas alkaloidigena TaxID=1075417 RepID=A0A1G9HA29_9BACT|nr:3-hydroxyacyl-CoA dehydrogenase NAD-binding domain-containing protein [Catalinimonas alkaloidigena]SDL09725.1 3-hydroxybutyryl-CoA dehydrogenase [Catalinimonas alkaloidigena]